MVHKSHADTMLCFHIQHIEVYICNILREDRFDARTNINDDTYIKKTRRTHRHKDTLEIRLISIYIEQPKRIKKRKQKNKIKINNSRQRKNLESDKIN